ncbi:MAG TPA: WhiB family transcriptional regulator [Streptosporangiaceae bacterium]
MRQPSPPKGYLAPTIPFGVHPAHVLNAASAEAKQICRRCPVRAECLAFATSNDERFGIWGGLDPDERRNLRRSMQRRKASVTGGPGAA